MARKKRYGYQRKYRHNWNTPKTYRRTVRLQLKTRTRGLAPLHISKPVRQRTQKRVFQAPPIARTSIRRATNKTFPTISRKVSNKALHRALICAKRQQRKEVIFATGSGGKKTRKPTYKPESQIQC